MTPGDCQPTDAQLLAEARQAYREALRNLSRDTGNNSVTRQRITDLREQIEWLEGRVAADATPNDGGIVLAVFK